MFSGCENIIDINFISFNTEYITNMEYMFYELLNLISINLHSFYNKNNTNYYNCFLVVT